VKEIVFNDVLANGNKFYFPNPQNPFMPLEFSVAAFRVGHSLIRDVYNWNRLFDINSTVSTPTLSELVLQTGIGGLRGRYNLASDWIINWNWFLRN
jgi:hypothetical protein